MTSSRFSPLLVSLLAFLIAATGFSCQQQKPSDASALQSRVQQYLDQFNTEFQKVLYASAQAQWELQTRIVEGDTVAKGNAARADEAFAKFTGSKANIDSAQVFLAMKEQLLPLQVRQLEAILFMAGNNPEVAIDVVKKRIDAQNEQVEKLYGFRFMIEGKEVTPNEIQNTLSTSINLDERLAAWNASKEVGKELKSGLASLRDLRNQSVTPLGYKDFFAYMASEYGMSTEEMVALTQQMITEVWPLYRELHTWARYTLAEKYRQPVPDYLPAHWLPNRWGQDWTALVDVQGLNIDDYLKNKGAEWIPKESERFYVSLGFDTLPETFWSKSSLYPVPPGAEYKKNTHASAWHMDNANDVRSLMSIEPNTEWWSTALHEFGHIYYYQAYTNPNVPIILRNGANRGFHEAFGTMMGLASLHKPFLAGLGMIDATMQTNDTMKLLSEALDYIVHIPWGSGTMSQFEHALYSQNLPADQFNQKWWELVKKYQGIVPPSERGEEYCDAATKTHINDDPAAYYDYSIANVLLFQFHKHIAEEILKQDARATNYWGNKAVGDFLRKAMSTGASIDWRVHLQDCIGSEMSAQPMTEYFTPLMSYLQRVNAGRTYSLPETASF
jgi:peptidyl-dipeptidase A